MERFNVHPGHGFNLQLGSLHLELGFSLHFPLVQSLWPVRGKSLGPSQVFLEHVHSAQHGCDLLEY